MLWSPARTNSDGCGWPAPAPALPWATLLHRMPSPNPPLQTETAKPQQKQRLYAKQPVSHLCAAAETFF